MAIKKSAEFKIQEEDKLLEFLFKTLTNLPKKKIKSLLAHKSILVNNKSITKFDFPLKKGDTVSVVDYKNTSTEPKLPFAILYEDDDIIVINKPTGLLTVGTDKEQQLTAYHILMDFVKRKNPNNRIFIVHRLDRDTSGIVVFAKDEETKILLQDNWEEKVLHRGYIAVVEGHLEKKEGTITSWLLETKTHIMYSSFTKDDGLKAVTEYKVTDENEDYSIVEISLKTGRKNQIRVHMKDLGCIVVGDKKYGSKINPMGRMGLHAHKLVIKHPITDKEMTFETAIPGKFLNLFKQEK